MRDVDADSRLSQIATLWTVVQKAHQGVQAVRAGAQERLLQRYSFAIHRYLLGATRGADAADDLFQEFAVRFLRGDFQNADPDKGRFRQYLKTALYRLVVDFHRRQNRAPRTMEGHAVEPAATDERVSDLEFTDAWRRELLDAAWERLRQFERESGQPLYTVLRFRTDHPEVRSPQMVERLAPSLGSHVDADWIRKRLHLARNRFADFLLDQVAQSLAEPTSDAIAAELVELELLEYCKPALERWESAGDMGSHI
jgi:RNA polymerase sigma-70 factor (ECF subfamily)